MIFLKKIVTDKNGDDFLWIVGGADGNGPRSADCCVGLNSTEFVYASGQTSSGPMLDFTIKDHCMVKLSDNTSKVILVLVKVTCAKLKWQNGSCGKTESSLLLQNIRGKFLSGFQFTKSLCLTCIA